MPADGEAAADGSFRRIASLYLLNLALSFVLLHSMFLSVFTPLPQMFCHLRLGRWAGLTILLVMLFVTAFLGEGAAPGYLVQFGIPGILIPEAIMRGYGVTRAFLVTLATAVGLALVFLAFSAWNAGIGIGEMAGGFAEKIITDTIAFNRKAGAPLHQIEEMERLTPIVAGAVSWMYPSLITVGIMLTLWLNILALARIMSKGGGAIPFGRLSQWKTPDHLAWGVILGGAAVLSGMEPLRAAGINILIVLSVVFFFQGMAIISYYFEKYGVPQPARWIGYTFAVWYLSVVVAVLGLFDIWGDFRRLSMNNGQGAQNDEGRS